MHLETDCFTIVYDPTTVSLAAVMEKIRGLGYQPQEIASIKPPDTPPEDSLATATESLPDLIASALAAAVEEDKLLLLDFYAAWCAPCKVLEEKVFTDAEVKRALGSFRLIRVDTDRYPEVAEYFKIRALPTLLVIDKEVANRYKHMGLIDADELVRQLTAVRQPNQPQEAQ